MKPNPCPICNQEMPHTDDYLDGWCLMSETEYCPSGHYYYSYETGITQITVFDEVFAWNYNTSVEDKQKIQKEIDDLIAERRITP